MSVDSRGLRGAGDGKDKKWEQVQIKAFTIWVNQTLEPLNVKIEDITKGLTSGVNLCYLLEESTHKNLGKWNRSPALRLHKIENLSFALKFIKGDLGVRLVGIGAEDIVDGNLKLTLGLLWSLFVKLRIETISTGDHKAQDGLLKWIRNMTEGYDHVDVKSFRESFRDGMAFAALVHSMDPDALDFDSLDPSAPEENLNKALDAAQDKLGIPRLLEVEDIMSGQIDERAMVLYNSLFFHAWNADEEKKKIRSEKESISDQLTRLKVENERFQQITASNEEELEFLRKVAQDRASLLDAMEQKIRILQALLDKNEADALLHHSTDANASSDGADKVEGAEGAVDEEGGDNAADGGDAAKEGSAGEGGDNIDVKESGVGGSGLSEEEKRNILEELETKRKGLVEEMETLRRQVAAEIKKREEQEALLAELRSSVTRYQSKEIVNTKARFGLDVLRSNLEEHLEELYHWKDLITEGEGEVFKAEELLEKLSGKPFEEQLEVMSEQLQAENQNLAKIVKLQSDNEYLNDTVLYKGWLMMKGKKEWMRRWFVLTAHQLAFYDNESCDKNYGTIEISEKCDVVRQQAVTEEESGTKFWPLKLVVSDKKLFLRATSKSERRQWFSILSSKFSLIKYICKAEETKERPDNRLIGILKAGIVPSVYLANRPATPTFVDALSRGLLGQEDLEELALVNSSLTDPLLSTLLVSIGKLPRLKRLNFSKNAISSAVTEEFMASVRVKEMEDLDVSHNQLGDEFLRAFASNLGKAENLHSLILDGNKFSSVGVTALVEALLAEECSITLADLSLNNNELGDDGVRALIPLFTKFSFKKIHLAGNNISSEGVAVLVDALKSSAIVEEVNLSYNNITADGAIAIRDWMVASNTLYNVQLSGNKGLVLDDKSSALFSASGFVFSNLTLSRS